MYIDKETMSWGARQIRACVYLFGLCGFTFHSKFSASPLQGLKGYPGLPGLQGEQVSVSFAKLYLFQWEKTLPRELHWEISSVSTLKFTISIS